MVHDNVAVPQRPQKLGFHFQLVDGLKVNVIKQAWYFRLQELHGDRQVGDLAGS
jgi:hypothetical protein